MGGGAAMRAAAAKVTGFGTQSTLRGATIVPPVEQPVRKASIPVSAVISSSSASQNVKAASDVASVQRPSWEMDDWEFADGDELVMSAGEPMPRVVFGGAPSFQEAKDATNELKDALDKVYLSSPKSSGCAEQVTTDQVAGMSLFSNSDSETKSCLIVETNPRNSTPKHALQAFKFLSGNPEAQNVVASIACDQNVWNAVMQNPVVLKQFIDSQQTVEEFQDPASPKKFDEDLSDHSSQSRDSKNGFMKDMMQKIKFRVSQSGDSKNEFMKDMMQNIKFTTDQVAGMSLFSNSDSETKSCLIVETNPSNSTPKHALQAFKFLSGSPEAQNVVASIVCDHNVRNAVMQNPVLQQFIDSQQTVEEFQDPASPKKFEEYFSDHSSQSWDSKNGFWKDRMQNIWFRVMDMVDNASSFFHNKFGPSVDANGPSVDADANGPSVDANGPSVDANGDTKSTFFDIKTGSIMGLVLLVIMVVMLKRG